MGAQHRQKLRVFQRIERLHERFTLDGQLLAVAQLVAVLRKLIVGRQVVGKSERNGIFAVGTWDGIAVPTGE